MFRDRRHAGELLAGPLAHYRSQDQTIVLGLPRGGVPVAAAVAHALALPLDALLVHKIGAPSEPELAVGAVAADGLLLLDEKTIERMHISRTALEHAIAREREELSRRQQLYREDRPPLALKGMTTILVDDGLATGYTMLAAIRAVRQRRPARVVVAVPVAATEILDRLRQEADEITCAEIPPQLEAVGQFYQDFRQISDKQVLQELQHSGSS